MNMESTSEKDSSPTLEMHDIFPETEFQSEEERSNNAVPAPIDGEQNKESDGLYVRIGDDQSIYFSKEELEYIDRNHDGHIDADEVRQLIQKAFHKNKEVIFNKYSFVILLRLTCVTLIS